MIVPPRALVRPQVFTDDTATPLSLVDEVRERIDARQPGLIAIIGPVGSGKTTALAELQREFSDHPFLMVVDSEGVRATGEKEVAAESKLVVAEWADGQFPLVARLRWRMAPWGDDELIEYCLAAHHDRCASIMSRVLADPNRRLLSGCPELCCPVLDALASDESLPDVKAALLAAITACLDSADARRSAGIDCLHLVCLTIDSSHAKWVDDPNSWGTARALLRHRYVRILLAAEYLAQELSSTKNPGLLAVRLPEGVIQETAQRLIGQTEVFERLNNIIKQRPGAEQPMAASLLLALDATWRPPDGSAPLLATAYLAGALWRGIRLPQTSLRKADLIEADLSEAILNGADLSEAQLSGANLHGATANGIKARHARLIEADLSHVRAVDANFLSADVRRTNFNGALLQNANFSGAILSGASLRRADLTGADFMMATVAGADFRGACLTKARLNGLTLRDVELTGAQLSFARLRKCDCEGVSWPGAMLEGADFTGAYLTASHMPGACLRGANLARSGLAEIDWERADLRSANFHGATFHMGSSRSGLVGSPIACEGSRTGFYTDELHEQGFKAPEEIRKANLRGADLRGAFIEGVDFYLVDLRDALYSPDQEIHFRRSGAILETRV